MDLRKKLFDILPKENITIFELKKSESTLEDAFIKLIDNAKTEEINQEEQKLMEEKKAKTEKKEQKKSEKKNKKENPKKDKGGDK